MKKIFKLLLILLVAVFSFQCLFSLEFNVNAAETTYIDVVSGTGKNVGDEVKIGSESFYIISNDGIYIRMLAKYNVDIAVKCSYSGGSMDPSDVRYDPKCGVRSSATNLQDSSISGIPEGSAGDVIGVPFSTDLQHGTSNTDYDNSVVKIYVDEYAANLNNKYGISVSGDILSQFDYNKIFYNVDLTGDNDRVKKFVNVTYWTRVSPEENKLNIVDGTDKKIYKMSYQDFFGVRPVIVAPATSLKVNYESQCEGDVCYRDINKDGKVTTEDEVCIANECFYVLSNDSGTVKLLSKYNLNTGLTCVSSTHSGTYTSTLNNLACESISSDAELKQVSNSRGFVQYPTFEIQSYGGVTYDQSTITNLLNQYAEYINNLSGLDATASLLTLSDIEKVSDNKLESVVSRTDANNYSVYLLDTIPGWIYSGSYWTMTESGTSDLFAVTSIGVVTNFSSDTIGEFGIRPVITLSEEKLPTAPKNIDDESACYICGDDYVWTDEPDSSSCQPASDKTTESSCVKNNPMGIESHSIMALIIISLAIIALALVSRLNRFKRI